MTASTIFSLSNLLLNCVTIGLLFYVLRKRTKQQTNTEKVAAVAYESGVAEGRTTMTLSLLGRLQGAENVEAAVQAWMAEEITILDLEQKPSYMDLMVGDKKGAVRLPRVSTS